MKILVRVTATGGDAKRAMIEIKAMQLNELAIDC